MARSWHYPRWRRYAMQASMWLILGATVGLAALVNHERRRALRVELGSPIASTWLTVRLPKSWESTTPPAGDRDTRVIARAAEPDAQGLGRTVTITRDRLTRPISPLEYLLFSSSQILGLDLLQAQHARARKELIEPITVGGWPGVLVRGVRASGRGGGNGNGSVNGGAGAKPHKEIYAATVLPSGHAIVIKLEGDRPVELSDVEIVKQLAGAVEIGAQPTLGQSGEIITLEGGIRLSVPEGFRPVYENDQNLLRRRLWSEGDITRWSIAELVPCLLAPGEGGDETMAIRALAAVHDPALRDATIAPAGPRRWHIVPPATAGPFAPRGYLLADDLGDAGAMTAGPRRALFGFFHAAAADSADDARRVDAAWEALARSVSFLGKTDFGSLLEAGKSEADRLRKERLADLLPPSGEQWWLWSDQLERRDVGWSHVTWTINRRGDATSPVKSEGALETVFRSPAGARVSNATMQWSGDLRTYNALNTVIPADPAQASMRSTSLASGKLVLKLVARGQPIAQGAGDPPPQFVSGGWLPLLVGKLSATPMILQSDALLGHEPIGAPVPLMLIVQPLTLGPVPTDTDGTPLRCLSIRINGSSEASRWYIRPNGQVHHVTFAHGLTRMPSDKDTKVFTFGPEP